MSNTNVNSFASTHEQHSFLVFFLLALTPVKRIDCFLFAVVPSAMETAKIVFFLNAKKENARRMGFDFCGAQK